MNFTGTLDSVSTLAHEMGHSMHSLLANRSQPPQYANYTLFVAEVASTVNENLMIEQLLENERDPAARLALLNQYLENFKGTVFRQTMFAEFERDAHAMRERGEALSPAAAERFVRRPCAGLFRPRPRTGRGVRARMGAHPAFLPPVLCLQIRHRLLDRPWALSEAIRSEGEPAVRRYLEFLSMGGSAYPLDELRYAGVRPWPPLRPSRRRSASSRACWTTPKPAPPRSAADFTRFFQKQA